MTRLMRLTLFAAVAAAQLAVPAWMIADREITLRQGQAVRFKCKPVDPYDAFRGRFVALGIESDTVAWTGRQMLSWGQPVYALLAEGPGGFTEVSGISLTRPKEGLAIQAKVGRTVPGKIMLSFPFDRYYMDEYDAPEAERAYERSDRTEKSAYITVRVRGTKSVLEELYIADMPVREYLRATAKGDF